MMRKDSARNKHFRSSKKRLLLEKVRPRRSGFEEETEPQKFTEDGRGSKKRQVSKKKGFKRMEGLNIVAGDSV